LPSGFPDFLQGYTAEFLAIRGAFHQACRLITQQQKIADFEMTIVIPERSFSDRLGRWLATALWTTGQAGRF